MSTALPPLPLEGAGTFLVESLASYTIRLAWTHAATPFQFARLLSEEWAIESPGPGNRRLYLDYRALCSYSPSTAYSVQLLQRLTGQSNLSQGTLLPLRGLLGESYSGCIAEQRHWCSACYEAADEGFAEPLAWGMSLIARCPVHDIPLQWRCASCGSPQRHFRGMHLRHNCVACGEKLSKHREPSHGTNPWADWCQIQMLHMLGALADDPGMVFPSEPIRLFIEKTREWTRNERAALHKVAADSLVKVNQVFSKPRLRTVFRIAALQGCTPLELLQHPEQCASRMLFSSATPIIPPPDPKPRVSLPLLKRLDDIVQDLLSTPEHLPLPPLKNVCRAVGLRASVLWNRRRDAYTKYSQERAKRRLESKHRFTDRAMAVALEEIRGLRLSESESTGRKRSVAKIMKMTGLPKHVADDAWTQVLRVVVAARDDNGGEGEEAHPEEAGRLLQ